MLKNFILETTNAPGTSATISLAGVASGPYSTFRQHFSTGAAVYFTITDGTTVSQTFRGTLTYGTPDILTVVANLASNAGTTTRINFNSGTYYVSNFLSAEAAIYLNASNIVAITGGLTTTGNVAVGGVLGVTTVGGSFNGSVASPGWFSEGPTGIIRQFGANNTSAGGSVGITFPTTFPTACWGVNAFQTGVTAPTFDFASGAPSTTGVNFYSSNAATRAVGAAGFFWEAWGH